MEFVVTQFKWIMLIGGVVTLTMLQAAIAPCAALRSLLGDEPQGPLALLLARNWGVLIALTGAMLIWGAFHPEVRPLVLIVAALLIDATLVAMFAIYLVEISGNFQLKTL